MEKLTRLLVDFEVLIMCGRKLLKLNDHEDDDVMKVQICWKHWIANSVVECKPCEIQE